MQKQPFLQCRTRRPWFGGRAIAWLAASLLTLGMALPLCAQITTARLSGTVFGPSGGVVPGARVTAVQTDTGYTRSTTSSGSGDYLFPSLPVGSYEVSVTLSGFSPYTQRGIVLSVGQTATVDVKLQLAAVSQQVTVHANASMVTTDSPTVSDVISQRDIVKLPLNGREVQQLVFLQPGATNVTSSYCAFACEIGIFPGEQYAKVNGAPSNGVSYQMDGVDYNDTYINTNYPFPNPDAIQEFNLVTGNMSALYGNAVGAVVNVITKSGTNAIHGDLFEFIRNAALDSRNWFADSVAPLKQNQFGGSIGGPILKNRLFYFGTYQGTRISTADNGQVAFVPNAAERKGDFSDLLPDTQLVNPYTGDPYPNNQVPVSPAAAYLLGHIPLPNGPNDQLTYNGSPDRQNSDQFMIKADLNAGSHHISGRYFQLGYDNPAVLPSPDNLLQTRGDAQHLVLKSVSVVDTYTISQHFLLNSYYGFVREDGRVPTGSPFGYADAGVKIAQPAHPVLWLTVGDDFGIFPVPLSNWTKTDQSLREVASWIRGNDQLQFGGEVARIHLPMNNLYLQSGSFDFSNGLTGNPLSDFVSGAVSNFVQGGGLFLNFTGYRWNLFVQNNWKATDRLTVDVGLRWSPFIPYTDSEGRVACFVPGAQSTRFPNAPIGMLFGGKDHDPGCPKSSIYNNPWNLAPRLGFAYRLTRDGKTSIRGGVGYYYQPPNLVAFQDVVGIPPFAPILSASNVDFDDPYGSAGLDNPFPGQFGPLNPGPDATFPSGGISFSQIFDRHFRLPMVLAYNLTLERQFGSDWLLRVAYVGNTAHHLSGTGDQELGLLQLNPPGDPTYPNYGSIGSINSGVNANYNGTQIILQKRFSHGLSLMTNFTWERSLDDYGVPGPGNFALTNSCICGRSFDYGVSPDDLNKVFKLNADYQLPRMRMPAAAGKLLNGWEVSGIANWNSGTPFTVFSGVDNSGSGIGSDRADLLASSAKSAVLGAGRSHTALVNEWFKTSDFAVNQPGTYGNSGKGSLRSPRFFNTDLSAMKTTRVGDRLSLEFRAEFYNLFNNVNFGPPDNVVTDSGFGQITSAGDPRIMQFALKALF